MKFNNFKDRNKTCIFFPLKKTVIFFLICLLASLNICAQSYKISGRVVNEQNEPIPNVTITLPATDHIFTGSAEGAFEINYGIRDTIMLFTSVGYKPFEYLVMKTSAPLLIRLTSSARQLDEIELLSSGYQDIPKERATGAFVKIDHITLNQQSGTNILKRLDGVTSGLSFNTPKQNNNSQNSTNISIRGLSTINGPLDPLIVLDGFIYEGNISNINPADVDNVTILKDAAAASIWGARAGNGVIIISTRKGRLNQKLQVDFNSNIILSAPPVLKNLPVMSSGDYIDVEQFLFNQGYFDGIVNTAYTALTPAVEIFFKRSNGLINAADSATAINALKAIDGRSQYRKYIYQNALTQQYSVNLRGGHHNNAYTFSLGYDKNISELSASSGKLNIRVNNIYRPVKPLTMSVEAFYTSSRSHSGKPGYNSVSVNGRKVPYLALADDKDSPLPVAMNYRGSYTDTAGSGQLLDWKYYPLEDYRHSINKINLQELFANFGLQYSITTNFSAELKYQYQRQETHSEQLNDMESYYARNMINSFSQLDRSTGIITYPIPLGAIRSAGNAAVISQTGRAQLNFNKSWRQHTLSAILGGEIRQAMSYRDNNTLYGYNEDPIKYGNVDFVNYYPNFITGSSDKIPASASLSSSENRFISLYFNGSYTVNGRYILSFSARRDGSNLFGASSNDKWKPLWSMGAGWSIHKEHFYRSRLIPLIKLRATYGFSGNVDLSRSAFAVGSYFTSSNINLPFVQINSINNPSLKWEKIGMFNLGIEFGSKGNVLSGTVEYYFKKGIDLYGLAPYDYTAWGGSNLLMRNVANMEGKGLDVVLNSRNLRKSFTWNTSLLLNYNNSKTTKYQSEESQSIISFIGSGNMITPVIGKPLYAIAAYKWGGLDNKGNPQGFIDEKLSTDYYGIFNEATLKGSERNVVYVGPANPTIFGSVINTFIWKKVSLAVNISYRLGYYFLRPALSYSQLVSSGLGNSDFGSRWKNPGDEAITNIPSFAYPASTERDGFYALSDVNVLNADHVRLQYINLAYSLRKSSNIKTPRTAELTMYVNAANLGILWYANKDKIDPDYPAGFSPVMSVTLGIRANFK